MNLASHTLSQAVRLHKRGEFAPAEKLYRQVLRSDSAHADALHLLGVVFLQTGRHRRAAELIRQATAIQSDRVEFHGHLAEAFLADGRTDSAAEALEKLVELQPENGVAWFRLGNAFKQLQRLDDAVRCYSQAVALAPELAEAEFNLANTFRDQGRLTDAEMHYRRAVQTVPDFAEVWNNLGVLLQDGRRFAEADDCLQRAVRCRPDYAEAYNNLGNVLRDRQEREKAVAAFRRCLQIRPDFADVRVNLGGVLTELGRWDDAESVLREAVRLAPDHFRAHNTLGMVLFDQDRAERAIDCYDTALRIASEFAEARCNRALAELYLGNGERGWRDYEARWDLPQHQRPCFRQQVWDGSDLAGRTIFLDWEQGLGDTIQFVRFANVVKQHGGRVVLRCQKPLAALLRQTPGIERIVPDGGELPMFDRHASLLSMPGILNLSLTSLPDCVPYIFAERQLHEHWQRRLQSLNGYRIGIFWQGNSDFQRDEFRSIPLKHFLPLAQIPGVRLISLQKGAGCEQIREFGSRLPLVDFGDELDEAHGAFMDTAGILGNLDLVITADSAVAHLAGAMGVPVCVALCRLPEWRWIRGRRSSPWYPTMRLYRQETLGDWASVFREIADDMHGLLESGNTTGESGASVTGVAELTDTPVADTPVADAPDSPEHLHPIVVRGIQP